MSTKTRGQGFVSASDGLPSLEVAAHAKEKEFVVERIVSIFNAGMQNKWDCRYYVDPFAGPGVCRIRETITEIDGSPMLAAKSKSKFTDYYLGDNNPDCLTALEQRISGLVLPEKTSVRYYKGDADTSVSRMIQDLPPARSSLGLAVFDPWGWDFSFDTIGNLAESRRIDLIVNFPIGFIKRNWKKELPQLDKFMHGVGYKEPFLAAMRGLTPGEKPARVLLDAYAHELHNIGYRYVKDNVVVDNSKHTTLYCLLFASKHERGADFWDKVTQRKESGQFRMLS
jgi:three-Cys-motif partner protein